MIHRRAVATTGQRSGTIWQFQKVNELQRSVGCRPSPDDTVPAGDRPDVPTAVNHPSLSSRSAKRPNFPSFTKLSMFLNGDVEMTIAECSQFLTVRVGS